MPALRSVSIAWSRFAGVAVPGDACLIYNYADSTFIPGKNNPGAGRCDPL
jgi:hypothetical protein